MLQDTTFHMEITKNIKEEWNKVRKLAAEHR